VSAATPAEPFRILVVCTGNICRSPFAEVVLRAALARIGSALANPAWSDEVDVASAGTFAMTGNPIEPAMAERLVEYGVDADEHVARQLERDDVKGAGLLLALSREHRRDIVAMLPNASRRVFALNEFSRLVADAVAAGLLDIEPAAPVAASMETIVDAAAMRRGFAIPPEDAAEDDVLDPYGLGPEAYAASSTRIGGIVADIERSILTAAGVAA
jgi:protein-tyrosine phosphatase